MEQMLVLDAAHEDGDGPVGVREPQLIERFGHGLQRQHTHPAQPALGLPPDVGQPPVVAPADRDLSLWTIGNPLQKQGGPEHLDVHAELVHVFQADLHVFALSRFLRSRHLAPELRLERGDVRSGHGLAGQASDLAIDVPVFPPPLSPGTDHDRTELLL